MLAEMMGNVMDKNLASQYPHLKLPAVVFATVASVAERELYEWKELVIHNDEGGGSFKGHIEAHWYEYSLTVVDRFGAPDDSFPAIPGVRSKLQIESGALVAVGLAYGEINPVIIGEVVL